MSREKYQTHHVPALLNNQQNERVESENADHLGICTVGPDSSLCAQLATKDTNFLRVEREDADASADLSTGA